MTRTRSVIFDEEWKSPEPMPPLPAPAPVEDEYESDDEDTPAVGEQTSTEHPTEPEPASPTQGEQQPTPPALPPLRGSSSQQGISYPQQTRP